MLICSDPLFLPRSKVSLQICVIVGAKLDSENMYMNHF